MNKSELSDAFFKPFNYLKKGGEFLFKAEDGLSPEEKQNLFEEGRALLSTDPEKDVYPHHGGLTYEAKEFDEFIKTAKEEKKPSKFLDHVRANRARYLCLGGAVAAAGGTLLLAGSLVMAALGIAVSVGSYGAATPVGIGMGVGGAAASIAGGATYGVSFRLFQKSWKARKRYKVIQKKASELFYQDAALAKKFKKVKASKEKSDQAIEFPQMNREEFKDVVQKAWKSRDPERTLILEKVERHPLFNEADKKYFQKLSSAPLKKVVEAYEVANNFRQKYRDDPRLIGNQDSFAQQQLHLLDFYIPLIKELKETPETPLLPQINTLLTFVEDKTIAPTIRIALAEYLIHQLKEKGPGNDTKVYDSIMIQKFYNLCVKEEVRDMLLDFEMQTSERHRRKKSS